MQTVLVHADDHKSEANFYDNQEIDYYVADVESFLRVSIWLGDNI